MPNITLPDGSERQFENATTGAEIAASIGEGLARAAVAVKVDGEMYGLRRRTGVVAA
jgi:threonyl-tRNA synthetase